MDISWVSEMANNYSWLFHFAHNLKVAGSSSAPASKELSRPVIEEYAAQCWRRGI
jgi:hypothetical protein